MIIAQSFEHVKQSFERHAKEKWKWPRKALLICLILEERSNGQLFRCIERPRA